MYVYVFRKQVGQIIKELGNKSPGDKPDSKISVYRRGRQNKVKGPGELNATAQTGAVSDKPQRGVRSPSKPAEDSPSRKQNPRHSVS